MQPPSATGRPVRLGRMAPTLPVSDIARSVLFYASALGFEKVFENGSPVGFVILQKDAAELHLTLDRAHKATVHNLAQLMVDDAEALYEHLQRCRVRIVKALRDADFGLRCFVFADPDGNRIDVGQSL
ncbi:MAG: VOC family protein [Ottowia sp.]|uniref:VOC family protein n=1 Tax=Ottowia sp. TaxID=1898956 RepID=UPI0039E69EFA